jgi:predicted oxidoreductase
LAWLLKHPAGILPVLGTTKIARLEAAVDALKIELTDEEWFELLEASVGSEVA